MKVKAKVVMGVEVAASEASSRNAGRQGPDSKETGPDSQEARDNDNKITTERKAGSGERDVSEEKERNTVVM